MTSANGKQNKAATKMQELLNKQA